METVAVQLRRAAGIERAAFAAQTNFALDHLVGPKIRELTEFGLLHDDAEGVRLTRRGKCVADAVNEQLMRS
jgi:oxygen-independent coproporphyrinogen-3 oxidase